MKEDVLKRSNFDTSSEEEEHYGESEAQDREDEEWKPS